MRPLSIGAGGALLVLSLLPAAQAQSRFATSVVSFHQGVGGGLFDTARILGGPHGGGFGNGSLDILTLGAGGDVTLAFDVTITDGPGADLSVFENGFAFNGGVYTELCLVEVSTNGIDFARFPTRYSGPPGPLDPFGSLPYGSCAGLSGFMPVLANVSTNAIDPFDPVRSGGESFDLAELSADALVLQGLVDLDAIHFVRLVDVLEGSVQDSFGTLIWDNGGPNSGADMDAVAVIQHQGNQAPSAPSADLFLDAGGYLHCVLGDPDGLGDLDWTSLSVSFNLVPLPFQRLRDFFTALSGSSTELHLISPNPIAVTGIQGVLAISVRDLSGQFSGDQQSLHF